MCKEGLNPNVGTSSINVWCNVYKVHLIFATEGFNEPVLFFQTALRVEVSVQETSIVIKILACNDGDIPVRIDNLCDDVFLKLHQKLASFLFFSYRWMFFCNYFDREMVLVLILIIPLVYVKIFIQLVKVIIFRKSK